MKLAEWSCKFALASALFTLSLASKSDNHTTLTSEHYQAADYHSYSANYQNRNCTRASDPLCLFSACKAHNKRQHQARTFTNEPSNNLIMLQQFDELANKPLDGQYTLAEVKLIALAAHSKSKAALVGDRNIHRYDNFNELKLAVGPEVNQEQCLSHLNELIERAKQLETSKYSSTDLNLYQLFDTFGRFSTSVMQDNSFFEGMYHECQRIRIRMPDGQRPAGTRYCVASLKQSDFEQLNVSHLLTVKAGVCLPHTCDSLNYKNKYELVARLFESQLRTIERKQIKLESLYCLPGENSRLRSVLNSSGATMTLVGMCAWLAWLAWATHKRNSLSARLAAIQEAAHKAQQKQCSDNIDTHCQSMGANDAPKCIIANGDKTQQQLNFFTIFSISDNLCQLFETSKQCVWLEECLYPVACLQPAEAKQADEVRAKRKGVDLSCIEGVKVVAMCIVITGNVLMCLSTVANNRSEVANSLASMVFGWLTNLAFALAMDAFFIITALLTIYLLLRQSVAFGANLRPASSLISPSGWFALVVHKYLRIMPIFALVLLYTKSLAKYTGAGPLWDYGTSAASQRKMCEQESWWWPLLLGTNFLRNTDRQCLPTNWYLSNDFQFFLLAPPFAALLWRNPKLGERVLKLCLVASYFCGFFSILLGSDQEPIADRSLSAAKLAPKNDIMSYITQFSLSHTGPQHRITAYLVGMLIGHRLFRFERKQLNESPTEQPEATAKIDGDYSKTTLNFSLVLICCLLPVVCAKFALGHKLTWLAVALFAPTCRVIFANAIGNYVLAMATCKVKEPLNEFLSSPIWKPFGLLSLCAMLVNVEVINFIIQSNSNLHYVSLQYQLSLILFSIMATYIVSACVFVLFEAPLRSTLKALTTLVITVSTKSNTYHPIEIKVADKLD